MKPHDNLPDFERTNPLWKFSPYLCGRIDILLHLSVEIVHDLNKGLGRAVDHAVISRAEESLWLWLLGAYEMVRTMCQADGCFSNSAADALKNLKHELAAARMPAAKMERAGRRCAVTSSRSPVGIDAQGKDLLIGDPNHSFSARRVLARFNDVILAIAPSDVLKPHESSYGRAS